MTGRGGKRLALRKPKWEGEIPGWREVFGSLRSEGGQGRGPALLLARIIEIFISIAFVF